MNGRIGTSSHQRAPLRRAVRFLVEPGGATASEYAVILALLIITVMVSINALGMSVTGSFTNVDGNLAALAGTGGGDGGDPGSGGGAQSSGDEDGGDRGRGFGRGGGEGRGRGAGGSTGRGGRGGGRGR